MLPLHAPNNSPKLRDILLWIVNAFNINFSIHLNNSTVQAKIMDPEKSTETSILRGLV